MHDLTAAPEGSAPEPRPLGWVVVERMRSKPEIVIGLASSTMWDSREAAEKSCDRAMADMADWRQGLTYTVEPVGAPPREPGEAVEGDAKRAQDAETFDAIRGRYSMIFDRLDRYAPEQRAEVLMVALNAWCPGCGLLIGECVESQPGCCCGVKLERGTVERCPKCETFHVQTFRTLPPFSPQSEPREPDPSAAPERRTT